MNHEKKEFMAESYNKRMNILVHGIDDEKDSPWETCELTLSLKVLLKKASKLQTEPAQIAIADIYHLPQRPIFRHGRKVNRPIIVKLVHTNDKSLLFRQLKNLITFNEERRRNNKGPAYLTDHLSEVFFCHKKLLMPQFKRARENNRKAYGKAENGEYVLYVDEKKLTVNELCKS